ncbi:hypothetical protein ACFWP7_15680 [Streptomyces sp. NPDC058470]|uniref:hypothetical protein n=1 Tax=Streptomyces sp. NPDC058470 TaxID=3346515 RepID=UPI0036466F6E
MGTSTRWKGPGGTRGADSSTGKRWTALGGRLGRLEEGQEARIESAADACLTTLRDTMHDDPYAFGLSSAWQRAGERVVDVMGQLGEYGPEPLTAAPHLAFADPAMSFVAEFSRRVAGDGTTLVDAAVRRAATRCAQRFVAEYPEATQPTGRGLSGDLLCLLYQWFFAGLVTEFLHCFIAEHIKLAVPVLPLFDPSGTIADLIAERVLELVPDPCEETAYLEAPLPLPQVAQGLVPGAVGKVLGLVAELPGTSEVIA